MEVGTLFARLGLKDDLTPGLTRAGQGLTQFANTTQNTTSQAVAKLEERVGSLTERLGLQGRSLGLAGRELEALKQKLTDTTQGIEKKQAALDALTASTERTGQAIQRTSQKLEKLQQKSEAAAQAVQNQQAALQAAFAAGDHRAVQQAAQELERLTQEAEAATLSVQRKQATLDRLTASATRNAQAIQRTSKEIDDLKKKVDPASLSVQRKQVALERLAGGAQQTARRIEGLRGEIEELQRPVGLLEGLFRQNAEGMKAFFAGMAGGVAVGAVNSLISALGSVRDLVVDVGRQAFESITNYEALDRSLEQLAAREMLQSGAARDMAHALELAVPRAAELRHWIESLPPAIQDTVTATYALAQTYGFTGEQSERLALALANFASTSKDGQERAEGADRAEACTHATPKET